MGVHDDYDAFIDNSSYTCYIDEDEFDDDTLWQKLFLYPESAYKNWHGPKRLVRPDGTITGIGDYPENANGDFIVTENGDDGVVPI